MVDRRSKRKKLEDMANQSVSPHEAAIAKEKLEAMVDEPEEEESHPVIHFAFDFEFPFNQSQGHGVFTYDFVKQKWIKID